jgi:hypothetical protein
MLGWKVVDSVVCRRPLQILISLVVTDRQNTLVLHLTGGSFQLVMLVLPLKYFY